MSNNNLNAITPSNNINLENPPNSDFFKKQKESFLAPTPSYKPDYQLNPQPSEKNQNIENMKGPNSSQYPELFHRQSYMVPSLFGMPNSPAYPQNVNYFAGGASTPNSIIQRQQSTPLLDQNHIQGISNQNNNLSSSNSSHPDNNISTISNSFEHSSYGIMSECSEDIQPKLQNIVSTANLKCKLDLRNIALQAKNAEYNPKRFAAVIMRIKEPKTTALIFASGKMVCTGARSEEDSKKAARQYAKIIRKLGYDVSFSEFKIQNIVGSCDVKFLISLEGLSTHGKFCSYEPEIFPGLIFKMVNPKIVLLIFVSGKIVLTGAKERKEIFDAFQKIYPVLQRYRKNEIPKNTESKVDLFHQQESD